MYGTADAVSVGDVKFQFMRHSDVLQYVLPGVGVRPL